ncbi:NUDIX domain-containing protein [Actinokineospora soli]|uniref:NUDIX domain-containing protein n=1 Tax=Actinokineospora soli TaxID=1048753 RepID=A0ABW2U0U1_9PSEU
MQLSVAVGRRAARAILIDDLARLVLIKRIKPGQAPYWTAPGGGVENTDASVEAALHRELAEELGAEVTHVSQVFLFSSPSDAGVAVQHFFVARLARLDESAAVARSSVTRHEEATNWIASRFGRTI